MTRRRAAARVSRIIAMAGAVALAAAGVGGAPVAVLSLWALALSVVGPTIAMLTHSAHHDCRSALRVAAVGVATAILGSGVIAGVIVVLGLAAAPVITVAAVASAWWAWRYRGMLRLWREQLLIPEADLARQRLRDDPPSPTPTSPTGFPVGSRGLSTPALCLAWERSFQSLQESPTHRRCEVAALRQAILDELERRDPSGFRRWLDSQPRADSDPCNHLSLDR